MKIKFIFFSKSRSTVFKMSIAGESPELKKIIYLQPIMEKLLQLTLEKFYPMQKLHSYSVPDILI